MAPNSCDVGLMAKVVYGQGVAKMSGRLGGSVYANNRGGAYVRNFVRPVNARTSYQEDQRGRVSDQSAAWRTLSSADQDAWTSWASTHPITDRLGNSILRSGHQAFVGVNVLRVLAGDATSANVVPGDPTFVASPIAADWKALDISDTKMEPKASATLPISTVWFCYSAPPVSAGVQFTFDKEKLLKVVELAAEVAIDAALANLWTDYVARFGTITGLAGRKFVCRILQYDEGQLGNPSLVSGLLVA